MVQYLRGNLAKKCNAKNHISDETRLCVCLKHGDRHMYTVSAWNSHRSTISASYEFREDIGGNSQKSSEIPPWTPVTFCCVLLGLGIGLFGTVCQKLVSRTETRNYTLQYLWGVTTSPWPLYLLWSHKSSIVLTLEVSVIGTGMASF